MDGKGSEVHGLMDKLHKAYPRYHAISVKRVAIVAGNRQDLMTQKSLFALAMGELE